MEHGTCDSCGQTDADDLVALHRLYITPEAWDTEGSVTKVEEVERWCAACRASYPHLPEGAELATDTDTDTGSRSDTER